MSFRFPAVLAALGALACGAFFYVARGAEKNETKAAKGGSQLDVPDAGPKELLAFIKKTQKSPVSGATRKERMEHVRTASQAIVTAAERIAAAEADDDTAVAALKAEMEALTMLKRLGDSGAGEKLEALSDKLMNDKRPAVVQMMRLASLQQKLDKLSEKDPDGVQSFIAEAQEFLPRSTPEPRVYTVARATTVLLFNTGKRDEAAELGRQQADRFWKSNNPDLAVPTYELAKLTGQILEVEGHDKQAAELYRVFAERFSESDNPGLREAGEQFEGSARRLALVGQSMPIAGRLVNGGRFDIAQYKGKVVLVDFWATWCGPCLDELPNVKETYQKYHDRGFEVVGISLDSEVDKVTKFIKEEQIPWPILFEGEEEEASGWNHPLAKQYGVSAIPMVALINREGKVVTFSARGEKLGELVAELLGVNGSDGAGSKNRKKAG